MPHIEALQSLFDDLPVGITLVDQDGQILISNKASERILGIRRDLQVQQSAVNEQWGVCGVDGKLLPLEEIPTLKALRERRRISEKQVGLRRPDGHITWLEITAEPMPKGGALVVYQDITAWCDLTATNIRMKTLLQTALELGRMSYFIQQPGTRSWVEDPSIQRLLGSDQSTAERFKEAVEQQSAASPFTFEFRIPAHSGEPDRWFACRGEAVVLSAGSPPIRMGILQDITLQHREYALARAQAITQAKGRIAGYLAHEVNNPLAGVKNAALLIRRSLGNPERQEKFLDLIDKGILRIQGVIRSLTELNREISHSEPIPVVELVQDLSALLDNVMEQRNLHMELEMPPNLRLPGPEAEVVRQVMFNLILNAVEAAPMGSIITIQGALHGGHLELTVTDQGSGVPEDLRGAIWSLGFTTKRPSVTGGLTTGLALGRNLMRDLGGDLCLLPQQPGQGATFSIRLPLSPMGPEQPSPPPQAVMTSAAHPALRILLVDDESTFRETTADLLRGDGFLVDTAADGGIAVDLLRSNAYDLLISDIMMPGNANLDLIRCIREIDQDLPIVLVTGYPSVSTAVDALHLSVKAYLTKPLDYGALLAELHRIGDGIRTRRVLKVSQDRLLGWVGDMDRIQQMVRESNAFLDRDSAREVFALSLGNVAGVLLDMKTLFELTLGPEGNKQFCAINKCPRLDALESGIKEAVVVLEKTKHAFKSKELGNLRSELERLVGK